MKNKISPGYYLIILLIAVSLVANGQIRNFKKVRWDSERTAPGVLWKHTHTLLNDSLWQNINIIVADLKKREVSIIYNPGANVRTSLQASAAGAIAAINAGFFNIKEGGSATYIRTEGKIIDTDTAKKWQRNINMTGSVLIDSKGHVSISPAMPNSWYDSHSGYPNVLVTGPLLMQNRKRVKLQETSLVITRHPRTAAGVINRHKIVLVTLDGRTPEASGMTLPDLTDLMISLGCRDAVNLDGGGSTTMWIMGKPFGGVVNMPCDNKKFDHEGERAVSDIIIIR
jgi:exopolysaccharide biosynthesis protein